MLLSGIGESISVKVLLTPRDSLKHIRAVNGGQAPLSYTAPFPSFFPGNIIMASDAQYVLKGQQLQIKCSIICYYSQPSAHSNDTF